MQYLESQQRESEAAKEEAKRLRVKMKTYERYVFGVSVYVSTRGLNPGAYTHVYEHSNGVCVCEIQPGHGTAGSEGRGGGHDLGHGRGTVGCGAALHLLHLSQKVTSHTVQHHIIIFASYSRAGQRGDVMSIHFSQESQYMFSGSIAENWLKKQI